METGGASIQEGIPRAEPTGEGGVESERVTERSGGTGTVMGEGKTAGQREGWGCQGSALGKCHSEPGEGRVRAQEPRRADHQLPAPGALGRSSLTAPAQCPCPEPPGARGWEAASQKPRAGGGFTFAGGWRRSSPSSARRRLHVLSGKRRRRPRPLSLSLSPPGPVAAGSCAAAPTPPLLPPPLRGSLWTPPSSPRLRALHTYAPAWPPPRLSRGPVS